MELVLENGFEELTCEESFIIDGGKAEPLEVAEIIIGTVLVANSPAIAVLEPAAGVGAFALGAQMLGDGYKAVKN